MIAQEVQPQLSSLTNPDVQGKSVCDVVELIHWAVRVLAGKVSAGWSLLRETRHVIYSGAVGGEGEWVSDWLSLLNQSPNVQS